jgi:glycosyltransferase involved in cell wall biosynthesis
MYNLRLSIIVPIYNVENYLECCVDTLLCQDLDHCEYEIILVNDGSTDKSYEIAKSLVKRSKNIRLYSQKNGGLSSARNTGMKYAMVRYVIFVDSDDFIEKNKLEKILSICELYDLDLCFFLSKVFYNDGSTKFINIQPFNYNIIYTGEFIVLNGVKISSVWSCVYSHDFLKETNILFYKGIVHEDIDFNMKLYPLAKRIMFVKIQIYNYRRGIESLTFTKSAKKILSMISDNLLVANDVISYMEKSNFSNKIKRYYYEVFNSMLVSELISFFYKESNLISLDFIHYFINESKKYNLYPIRGKALSWKTSILIPLLNIEWLYFVCIKIIRKFI